MSNFRTVFISRLPEANDKRGFAIVIGSNQLSGEDFAQRIQLCIEQHEHEGFTLVHSHTAREQDAEGMIAIFQRTGA